MNLSRKLGPLPLWAWGLIGAAVAYLLYRHFAGSLGSSGQAVQVRATQPGSTDSALGLVPSAGAPADTGQSTSDYVAALGGANASLISALEATSSDIAGLASSQIAAAQTQTSLGSFNTNTQPALGFQPGGSMAPQIIYVQPQLTKTPDAQPPATVTTHARAAGPALGSRFFTYKRDVPLGPGQTVHFLAGRGYYAHG